MKNDTHLPFSEINTRETEDAFIPLPEFPPAAIVTTIGSTVEEQKKANELKKESDKSSKVVTDTGDPYDITYHLVAVNIDRVRKTDITNMTDVKAAKAVSILGLTLGSTV